MLGEVERLILGQRRKTVIVVLFPEALIEEGMARDPWTNGFLRNGGLGHGGGNMKASHQ